MQKKPMVYMVGNTHFDPVWLWTWDEGMASIRATFRSALDRMNEDPDFCYSFSCPPVFQWIEQTDPAMLEEIKQRCREGRWCMDEAMWLQADCFSGCGESYVRQCLYGQNYLMNTFGVYSDTAFNADCFGAPEMLPQILNKCHVPYAIFGRPDNQDLPLDMPLFAWRSKDGSEVLSYRIMDAAAPWQRELAPHLDQALAKMEQSGQDVMMIFGVTNHGGAPTKQDIAVIRAKQAESGGQVRFSGTTAFFTQQTDAPQVHVNGEIPIRFFGVFSDSPQIKKDNRRTEYALFNAEKMAVLERAWNGRPFPQEVLHRVCEDMLFNQFHDILGGACIKDAYVDAAHLHGRAIQTARETLFASLHRMTKDIHLPPDTGVTWNLVLWNPNDAPLHGQVEAEAQWIWEFGWYEGPLCVEDETGHRYPCQHIQARECVPGFRSRFLFEAEVPPLGYRVYRLYREEAPPATTRLCSAVCSETEAILENSHIRVALDVGNGGIASITNLRTGETRAVQQALPVVRKDESDVWAFNFTGFGEAEHFEVKWAKVLENGPQRSRIRLYMCYGMSMIEQDFLLSADSEEVECRYRVNWQEAHKTLKLAFKMPYANLTAATPYAQTVRAFDGRELPAGPWIDCTDDTGCGITLYSDSLFAYHTTGNTLEATVLRSPIFGDMRIFPPKDVCYEHLGQGITEGCFKLVWHEKQPNRVLWQTADHWNNPVIVIDESNHVGTQPTVFSAYSMDTEDDIRLAAMKEAEDKSGELILRIQNLAGCAGCATVTLFGYGTTPRLQFAPYEIKTIRKTADGAFMETDMLEIPC